MIEIDTTLKLVALLFALVNTSISCAAFVIALVPRRQSNQEQTAKSIVALGTRLESSFDKALEQMRRDLAEADREQWRRIDQLAERQNSFDERLNRAPSRAELSALHKMTSDLAILVGKIEASTNALEKTYDKLHAFTHEIVRGGTGR